MTLFEGLRAETRQKVPPYGGVSKRESETLTKKPSATSAETEKKMTWEEKDFFGRWIRKFNIIDISTSPIFPLPGRKLMVAKWRTNKPGKGFFDLYSRVVVGYRSTTGSFKWISVTDSDDYLEIKEVQIINENEIVVITISGSGAVAVYEVPIPEDLAQE